MSSLKWTHEQVCCTFSTLQNPPYTHSSLGVRVILLTHCHFCVNFKHCKKKKQFVLTHLLLNIGCCLFFFFFFLQHSLLANVVSNLKNLTWKDKKVGLPKVLLGERVHDRLSLRKINSETQNQECVCVCVQLVVCVYNERKLFILRVLEGTIVVKVGVNFLFRHFMLTKHFDASSLTPVMF